LRKAHCLSDFTQDDRGFVVLSFSISVRLENNDFLQQLIQNRIIAAAQGQPTCVVYIYEYVPEVTLDTIRTTVQMEIYFTALAAAVKTEITLSETSSVNWRSTATGTCEGTALLFTTYSKETTGVVTRRIVEPTVVPGTSTVTSRSTSCS
jgi:hypothetical protein